MSTSTEPLAERTATELRALLRARAVSCEEVARAFLERIERLEDAVGAWACLDPELTLAQARARDAAPGDGPLWGLPVAVKDLFDTRELPTAYGSPIYAGHRPAADAAAVRRLREAGAVLLGKSVTTEFAAVLAPAKTRSPFDPARTPGGSSSGSAAAVAVGMAPAALGTQTGGSVVRPASYCGIFGLKPTYGLIDAAGVKPVAPSLDTVGVFGRTVDDVALQLDALAGAAAGAPVGGEPSGAAPRIALLRTAQWEDAEPCVHDAFAAVARRLEGAGAVLEEVALDAELGELPAVATTILEVEVARSFAREAAAHPDALGEDLRAMIARGRATPADAYAAALERARARRADVDALLGRFDGALTPSTTGEPPPRASTGDPLFCRAWTLLGTPAISLPFASSPAGLPVGLQLVAARGADRRLLAAARWAGEACLDGGRVPLVAPAS